MHFTYAAVGKWPKGITVAGVELTGSTRTSTCMDMPKYARTGLATMHQPPVPLRRRASLRRSASPSILAPARSHLALTAGCISVRVVVPPIMASPLGSVGRARRPWAEPAVPVLGCHLLLTLTMLYTILCLLLPRLLPCLIYILRSRTITNFLPDLVHPSALILIPIVIPFLYHLTQCQSLVHCPFLLGSTF